MSNSFNKISFFLKRDLGLKLFNLGIFFLPSAVFIGSFLLLISLIIASYKKRNTFLKDKWNLPLFLSSGLMIISSLRNTIYPSLEDIPNWYISYTWISLINWIPLFICFWGFQEYLKCERKRTLFAKSLIIGTVPVIISCIGQYFFKWEGPLQLFDGLIIWFLKPIGTIAGTSDGLSGLFSNQNTAGFWLATVFPFSLLLLLNKTNFYQKKIFTSIICFSIFYLTILTNSRNALVGLLLSISILLGLKFLLIIILFLLILNPLYIFLLNYVPEQLEINLKSFVPFHLINKITRLDLGNILNIPRVEIFSKTLKMISVNPILGWGASTFPFAYVIYRGTYESQHAHNIFMHLAYEFGVPLALILMSMVIVLFMKSWAKIKLKDGNNNNLINKAWITSCLIGFIFHLSDITYYDLRVSLLLWTLLSGLKCIVTQKITAEI